MGSQNSKLRSDEAGVKRETSLAASSARTQPTTQDNTLDTSEETLPVLVPFRWRCGGERVFLTGAFTQWTAHVPMERSGDEFFCALRLPPGIYAYKFIVDGEWKCSPDDRTTLDVSGNLNNVVDTLQRSADTGRKEERKAKAVKPKAPERPGIPERLERTERRVTPDFDDEAPPAPPQYQFSTFKASEKDIPSHIFLNHFAARRARDDVPYSCTMMVHRYRGKYTTLVFYKKKNP
eukprot:TRINITY_DN9099_c0_g1_i6.p1 TRINITY_DN9099_c0_g1~~TRINITY_DN9099_c0_g1_i6.p1  ORF type:complete len:235 (+),score=40.08 TRINITY_DN9099_c0_g1_i6:147-851(+)